MWEEAEMCKNVRGGQTNSLRSYKMEYATDPSEQFANVEQFENGYKEQSRSSITVVCPEKDETVHIKTEYVTDSSEQFHKVEELKNSCEGQPSSSTTVLYPEKDENVQVKMKFAVDSSEQIENIEPWNMFTVDFSTPKINIEMQNDVAAPMSVNGSDARNLFKTNVYVPASNPLATMSKAEYLTNSIPQLQVCGTRDIPNFSNKIRKTRKTDAERMRAYRLRKKAEKLKVCGTTKIRKTDAERAKAYRLRKKAEKLSICGTGDHPNHSSMMGKTKKTNADYAKAYRLRKKAEKLNVCRTGDYPNHSSKMG